MSALINEIRQMIREARSGLNLREVESTSVIRKTTPPVRSTKQQQQATDPTRIRSSSTSDIEQTGNFSHNPSQSKPPKDFQPGFNLYHGIVITAFSDAKNMQGDTGEVVKWLTQYTLQEMASEKEATGDVFETNQPRMIAAIMQKAVMVVLEHISKIADAKSSDMEIFKMAND